MYKETLCRLFSFKMMSLCSSGRTFCTSNFLMNCCLRHIWTMMLPENPHNIAQEKFLCNIVWILLRQYCTRKTPCKVCWKGSSQHCTQKIQVVWTISGLFRGDFYFGLVSYRIIIGCYKCSINIVQVQPKFLKKNPGPTLKKKTRLYRMVCLKVCLIKLLPGCASSRYTIQRFTIQRWTLHA